MLQSVAMTNPPRRRRIKSAAAAIAVLAALVVLLGRTRLQAETQPNPGLHVESNTNGEIEIEARGVTIEEALRAVGSKAGFEVVLDSRISRRPLNVAVSMAVVEDVLREILRGRNYALVYTAGNDVLSRVILLPPPAPTSRLAYRARRRGGR